MRRPSRVALHRWARRVVVGVVVWEAVLVVSLAVGPFPWWLLPWNTANCVWAVFLARRTAP